MQTHDHNRAVDRRSTQCQPGEIRLLDDHQWQCYCQELPSLDWENDDKKMVVMKKMASQLGGARAIKDWGEVQKKGRKKKKA